MTKRMDPAFKTTEPRGSRSRGKVTKCIMIAQINVESKNPPRNFLEIQRAVINAIDQKALLIIFPELSVPGYFNGDAWECTQFLKECESYHKKIAKLSKSIDIIFGSVGIDWKRKNEDGRVRKYNAAFFAHKGKFIQNKKSKLNFWPKTLLPQYREFDDARYFFDLRKLAYEKKCRIEDLYEPISAKYNGKTFKIGISICEDIWDENYSFSPVILFSKKYKHDFFVNISASPFTLGKNQKRNTIFKRLTKKIKTPLIYVNCVGTQNIGKTIFVFDGSSKIYSKSGRVIFYSKFCKEEQSLFPITLSSKLVPVVKPRDDTTPRDDTAPWDDTSSRADTPKIVHSVLENAIQLICKNWNILKVVIGVSGGIDSALTSVLFSRVLGYQNVYLINMPTRFNSDITKNLAAQLARNLNCPYAIFPIEDIVNTKRDQINNLVFTHHGDKSYVNLSDFNFENIQARERGSGVLAAVASALNAVFCCNTNKSELTIGYGTLYGDLAGFLCPIGDLWKHQVYELARYYNEVIFKSEVIPADIFSLTPSAELSAEQDVRQGKGDPLIYEYHDYLFAAWVESWEHKSNEDCIAAYKNNTIDVLLELPHGKTKSLFPNIEKFEADLNHWWNLFQNLSAIKRVQSPPVIAISRRSFGFDYRESI